MIYLSTFVPKTALKNILSIDNSFLLRRNFFGKKSWRFFDNFEQKFYCRKMCSEVFFIHINFTFFTVKYRKKSGKKFFLFYFLSSMTSWIFMIGFRFIIRCSTGIGEIFFQNVFQSGLQLKCFLLIWRNFITKITKEEFWFHNNFSSEN